VQTDQVVDAGSYRMTITGIGSWFGKRELVFQVVPSQYFITSEASVQGVESQYFYPSSGPTKAETVAFLVITSDRGLAGAYNYNVIRRAEAEIRKREKVRLFVIGDYGRRYFKHHNGPVEETFFYTAQDPTFRRAREISYTLLTEYTEGRADEIRIIYSDMENDIVSTVRMERLLPFDRKEFLTAKEDKNEKDVHYEFSPSVDEVLNHVIPGYVAGCIYGALVDSFSAEQNARMTAMNSANKNAEALLDDLRIEYNRVRQAAITQEITEVAAGAKAQKKKRKKEES
jgi:F-type H+-transporting ATPase subunit gamma